MQYHCNTFSTQMSKYGSGKLENDSVYPDHPWCTSMNHLRVIYSVAHKHPGGIPSYAYIIINVNRNNWN